MTNPTPHTSTEAGGPATDWQPIASMPKDVRVELRRDDCPGWDTTGIFQNGRLDLASFFVRDSDMCFLMRPTHRRPLQAEGGAA